MQSRGKERVFVLAPTLSARRRTSKAAAVGMPWSILRELLFAGVAILFLSTLANALFGLVLDLVDRQRPEFNAWLDVAWSLALAIVLYRAPGPIWLPWATGTTFRLIVTTMAVLIAGFVLLWRIGQWLQYKRKDALDSAKFWGRLGLGTLTYLVRGASAPQMKCPACGEPQHSGARFCHACGKPAAEEP